MRECLGRIEKLTASEYKTILVDPYQAKSQYFFSNPLFKKYYSLYCALERDR